MRETAPNRQIEPSPHTPAVHHPRYPHRLARMNGEKPVTTTARVIARAVGRIPTVGVKIRGEPRTRSGTVTGHQMVGRALTLRRDHSLAEVHPACIASVQNQRCWCIAIAS